MSSTPLMRWARPLVAGIVPAVIASAALAAAPSAAAARTFVVLDSDGASSANAAAAVRRAHGSIVANYRQIGVVVARSSEAGFGKSVRGQSGVKGAAASTSFGVQATPASGGSAPLPGSAPATDSDTLSGLQWDMAQIRTPEAHAITGGSPAVVVGDLDTGLDFSHPDLAPNYDASLSTDCSSGVASPLPPGNDAVGHGTHTAGTIAAASNGTGIVGVAPNVRLAGIKTSNDDGFFFPEMVVCAYMWVAEHGIDVTNNSYFADPWQFNCRNDPEQRAIWEAERRAIRYAQSRGTVVVASEGNIRTDLSQPRVDLSSPDYPPGSVQERAITNACLVIPVEIPGVVGVTATGNLRIKSYYSSYGSSTADVAAPGGDGILQLTAAAPNGRVLSTYPATVPCARPVVDPGTGATYCYLQGTSMAAPHVSGVAALIISQTGARGSAVAAAIARATTPLPCPDDALYAAFPQPSGEPQHCSGSLMFNSFYGPGEVDALKAVGG